MREITDQKNSEYGLFLYSILFQVTNEKVLCSKDFTGNLRDIFIWK